MVVQVAVVGRKPAIGAGRVDDEAVRCRRLADRVEGVGRVEDPDGAVDVAVEPEGHGAGRGGAEGQRGRVAQRGSHDGGAGIGVRPDGGFVLPDHHLLERVEAQGPHRVVVGIAVVGRHPVEGAGAGGVDGVASGPSRARKVVEKGIGRGEELHRAVHVAVEPERDCPGGKRPTQDAGDPSHIAQDIGDQGRLRVRRRHDCRCARRRSLDRRRGRSCGQRLLQGRRRHGRWRPAGKDHGLVEG